MSEENIAVPKILEHEPPAQGGGEQVARTPEQIPLSIERAQPTQHATIPQPSGTNARARDVSPTHLPLGVVSIADIERVLSADLEDIYFHLPPQTQAAFKKKGEETARAVQTLLVKAKVNVKKIAKLIVTWLKIIPGVNTFFLEQESKIRTDEILKLKNDIG